MDRESEAKVVQRAASGDRDACAELVRAHQERLFAFLYRACGNRELAEEATQEAFVRALRHLTRFDPTYRFSTWLFTIARRVMWNMREKMRPASGGEMPSEWGAVAPAWSLSSWAVERDETSRRDSDRLQRALMELGEVQREIVLLYHQQGWSVEKIARFASLPQGTVKSHLYRARESLAASMSRMDAECALEVRVKRMEHQLNQRERSS